MRALGVGLVYASALEPLLAPGVSDAIAVVELEPQTLWEMTSVGAEWHYRGNEAMLERVAALPQAKLLHGIGHPLGGTVRDPMAAMPLLQHAVARLNPAWVSEHLSFNRVQRAGAIEHAGFLLPPPQTPAAVRVAAHNIDAFHRALGRPVAFETGVNYLQARDGEMADGDFFAAVAETADSGIVLDLHNLWCNERNGRQSVHDTLARMPLDRVWELHLAGGMQQSGYWLDAHSGAVPLEVMEIAARLMPELVNLGALIFEIMPEHLPRIGLDGVQRQIERLQQLWALRSPRVIQMAGRASMPATPCHGPATPADSAAVARWEVELVNAIGAKVHDRIPGLAHLSADPGCALLCQLIGDFRRASLARALHYTMTSLLAGLGLHGTHALLDAYFEAHAPEPFGALEADRFAQFLHTHLPLRPRIPYLDEVLAFEHALVRATLYGATSELAWSADPTLLFELLDAGQLPHALAAVRSTMRICAN